MKVMLLNGSPHEFGCTYTALSAVSEGLHNFGIETEIFHIGSGDIPGCRGCFACRHLGKCVLDDKVNNLAEKLQQTDGIIIGSPVYFASPNGALIAFLDRLYAAHGDKLMYKPCGCIVSARRAGTTSALETLHKYPTVNEQPLVSSGYWCMVHGNTPDEVRADTEGMEIAYTLGKNMAWMVRTINRTTPADMKENGWDQPFPTNYPKKNT